jgi:hypothetical protein
MEEFELLCRAKTYIDKLANGINPLNDQLLDENDVVNNVRLSRCFFYVSNVLREVIENGGSVQKAKTKRAEFSITDEELQNYQYSDEPISITHVVRRVNNLINKNETRRLSYKVVLDWLKSVGMLQDANGQYANAKNCPTKQGEELGISIEKRLNRRGEFFAAYYNRNAQEFIVSHIQEIVGK